MKNLYSVIIVLFLLVRVFSLDVEVEEVLDAPYSKWGTFLDDAVAYTANGELLFRSSLAFNIFVLKEETWVPLIDRYKFAAYNNIQQRRGHYNALFNSTIPGEFVYFMVEDPYPQENYRVFVNEEDELQAEWISQEYYDSHKFPGLGLGFSLNNGYQIKLTRVTNSGEGWPYWPEIVDRKGTPVYRFTDGFRDGFVEDTLTITTNPARDRVSMVISFRPEKESPYYVRSRPRLKKLVIFKIIYDSDCGNIGK
jgi:hypothetical protein